MRVAGISYYSRGSDLIVYGELTPEHIKGYREGKVALGGRFTSEGSAPDLHCMTCGHEWLNERL